MQSANGAKISTEALTATQQQSTLAAQAGQIALKGLATAGNMIVFALISKGIEFSTSAISNWIHRVENANKAMVEAVSEYKSAQTELKNINSEIGRD